LVFFLNKNPNSRLWGLEPGWLGCTSTYLAKWAGLTSSPSLYDLANATIGTNLEKKKWIKKDKKKDDEEEEEEDDDELIFGWAKVPLSFEQVLYAALDTRLGFEIRSYWKLQGYNSHVDRLNI
jgi:hypothetical protein